MVFLSHIHCPPRRPHCNKLIFPFALAKLRSHPQFPPFSYNLHLNRQIPLALLETFTQNLTYLTTSTIATLIQATSTSSRQTISRNLLAALYFHPCHPGVHFIAAARQSLLNKVRSCHSSAPIPTKPKSSQGPGWPSRTCPAAPTFAMTPPLTLSASAAEPQSLCTGCSLLPEALILDICMTHFLTPFQSLSKHPLIPDASSEHPGITAHRTASTRPCPALLFSLARTF